jgi:hypothetical protein
MRFENDSHLEREKRAIEKFTSLFNLTYKKLGENDVDFQVYNQQGVLAGFVEVKGRHRDIEKAYPLPIAIRKIAKLQGELAPRKNPVVVWACHDGIIYGKLHKIKGEVKFGGRPPREGATNDQEMMGYYPPQNDLHHGEY